MIRHPTTAKSDITKPDNDQIQPNTIDLRISEIFEVDNKEVLVLGESAKQTRTLLKLTTDEAGFYHLEGGKTYQVMSSTYIKVAENEIAIVMGRSTLNRNGVFVISSIYDSGFEDYIGASLYNLTGHTKLEKNSRFAHLIVSDAETRGLYNGSYGNQPPPAVVPILKPPSRSAMMTTDNGL